MLPIGSNVSGLPRFLPDETLYSLISRYHRLAGGGNPYATSLLLFGTRRRGFAHDFPSHLDHFVSVTDQFYGSAQELIDRRTLLPFYLRLRDSTVRADARTHMRHGTTGNFKYRLGIITTGFRAHHPLKACPRCMAEDHERWGIAYWHRAHQWPGVLVCTKHRTWLAACNVKINQCQRFAWLLPSEASFYQSEPGAGVLEPDKLRRLLALAVLAERWSRDQYALTNESSAYSDLYRLGLQRAGLLSPAGRLRLKQASHELAVWMNVFPAVPIFGALPSGEAQAQSLIQRLVTPTRSPSHPLRHLIFIQWLYGTWRRFMEAQHAYAFEAKAREVVGGSAPEADDRPQLRTQLLQSITEHGLSISAAAGLHGMSVATVQRIVASAGGAVARRPKKLNADTVARLRGALMTGKSVAEVAEEQEISVPTINRLLALDLKLKTSYKAVVEYQALKAKRALWQVTLEETRALGVKYARSLEPAAYAWLYRRDRSWLMNINRRFTVPTVGNNALLDWQERDRELAGRVQQAALELLGPAPWRGLDLWELCQAVHDLRPRLSQIDRLPQTRRAIEAAMRKQSANTDQHPMDY